ncbi:MAG TPA: glycosyltransferase family 87 protein [Vicinamibacterales bacterium]|nr:glycosyltransferase family 87 protein [Vicinamibacterales bacterium]
MTRRRALVWLAAAVAVSAALYLAIRQTRDLTDFEVYRTAGARVLEATPLYRPEDGHFVFKYLPAFAYAMVPFAIVGPEVARAAWFALSVACLVFFVAGSMRALPDRRRAMTPVLAWTIVVMARCDIRELSLGQTNALLGALLVAALLAVTRGSGRSAGALVGLATFVKPYTVLLAPWLAATVGLAALVASGLVVLFGLALPAASYGWVGNLDLLGAWFRTVTETTAPNLMLPENISFLSAWAKWIGPGPVATAAAAATTVGALAVVGMALLRRGPVRHPAYAEFALVLLLIPVLTPQGWDYMLLLATPAVICLVDRWGALPASWKVATTAALAAVALPMREIFGLAVTREVMGTGVLTLAALVLVAGLMRLRLHGAA